MSPRNPSFIGADGRGFHGTVTVGSRGQVSLPAQARRNIGLEPGDQLIVLSDPGEGLALVPLTRLLERAPADDPLAALVRAAIGQGSPPSPPPGGPPAAASAPPPHGEPTGPASTDTPTPPPTFRKE